MLGFLWCQGSKSDKLDFLYRLIKNRNEMNDSDLASSSKKGSGRKLLGFLGSEEEVEDKNDDIVWSDENLAHVFKRLFNFTRDLPKELYDEFKDYDIVEAQ